jgi:hypothetical protein
MCAMGKTKDLSAFEQGMVVGARCTDLSVSRTATLLGFFTPNSFPCISRTSSQLDTTIGVSTSVNMGQHPCGMFPAPCRVEAVLRAKGGEDILSCP